LSYPGINRARPQARYPQRDQHQGGSTNCCRRQYQGDCIGFEGHADQAEDDEGLRRAMQARTAKAIRATRL